METSGTVDTPQLLCRLFTDFAKYFCGVSFAFFMIVSLLKFKYFMPW